LTLETATPTFGTNVPTLRVQTLSFASSRKRSYNREAAPANKKKRKQEVELESYSDQEDDDLELEEDEGDFIEMTQDSTVLSSRGKVSATFRVPGLITIPCDGELHSVTIAQLKLNAAMTWVSVPKEDTKVHLKVGHHNDLTV
jgi:hypothetical protein